MKTKLLRLALCTFVAALPIGAWADREIINVNYAQLATDNFSKETTVNVVLNTSSSGMINSQYVYKFSYTQDETEVISESDVVTNRNVYFRFNNNFTIGLYHAKATQYGILNLQVGDILQVATNNGNSTALAGVEPASLVNLDKQDGTSTYSHHFNDGGTDKTLNFTVYTYTVTAAGLAGFQLTGAYVAYIKVTRPSNTACKVTSSSSPIYALNTTTPEGSLPASNGPQTATWSGGYSFTVTGASNDAMLRDLNNSKSARQITIDETEYRPIVINKNIVYTITKSNNIKSVTLYAKTNSLDSKTQIIFNYGLTGQTTAQDLPLLEETASSFDITDYANIRVSAVAVIAFKIEYYSSSSLTVADIGWASLCLPFAAEIPDGAKVYYAKSSTSSAVTLEEITAGNIPANTGVLVKASEGTYTFNALQGDPTPLPNNNNNLFEGITDNQDFGDNEIYVLAGSENENAKPLFKMFSAGTLSANKAYLPVTNVPSSGEVRSLSFTFDDSEITGIKELSESKVDMRSSEAYNLAGQRVSPDTKGLVIINGRKYINK